MTFFGSKINSIRLDKGITQEKLAELIETPRTVISMIETGARIPTRKQFIAINKALDINEVLLKTLLIREIESQLLEITAYDLLKLLRTIE